MWTAIEDLLLQEVARAWRDLLDEALTCLANLISRKCQVPQALLAVWPDAQLCILDLAQGMAAIRAPIPQDILHCRLSVVRMTWTAWRILKRKPTSSHIKGSLWRIGVLFRCFYNFLLVWYGSVDEFLERCAGIQDEG